MQNKKNLHLNNIEILPNVIPEKKIGIFNFCAKFNMLINFIPNPNLNYQVVHRFFPYVVSSG